MKHIPILTFGLLGLFAAPVIGQEPRPQDPIQPPAGQAQPARQPVAELIRQLGSDSFRARLEAERALRERAGEPEVVAALQEASKEGGDPEVQWRAQRLLTQIERGQPGEPGETGRLRQREPRTEPPAPPDLDQRFEDLFRDLRRDFPLDIPERRFFQDDFFRDLRAQLDELRRSAARGGIAGQGNSMSMQSGPDGVRVEIRSRNEKGEEDVKVYEAPDLKTFHEKYPGVLQGHGVELDFGGGRRGLLRRGTDGFGPGVIERDPAPVAAPQPAPPAHRRLGVTVQELAPEVRAFLELAEGQGLQVLEVQPDTLAAALGLRSGDVLLRIAGRPIGAVGDVAEAVGSVAAGQPVEVVVNRKGRERTLQAEKTAKPEPAAEPAPGRLEPRAGGGHGDKGQIR